MAKRSRIFSLAFGALGEHSNRTLNSSAMAGVTGTSVIPHLGHLPGAVVRTSGCIVQVYSSAWRTTSIVRWAGAVDWVAPCCPSPDGLRATSFIPHFGHFLGLEDWTSGCIGQV